MSRPAAHIVVAGASGYIGRHVVAELMGRGHRVTALLRQPPDTALAAGLGDAPWRVVDYRDSRALAAHIGAHGRPDAIVSCLAGRGGGIETSWAVDHDANQALLAAAKAVSASRFCLLSALCVQTPKLAFQHAKLAFEASLASSELAWSIVRPTAFFKSLAGQIERVRQGRPFLLFGAGDGPPCLPISEADLADFIADTLFDDARSRSILPIGGPGPAITPRERGELLFAHANRTPRFRHVPVGLLRFVEQMARPVGRLSARVRNIAEFARIAQFYATEPMLAIDPYTGLHSAEATPRHGQDTLAAFYEHAWAHGLQGQDLGEQALFDRRRRP